MLGQDLRFLFFKRPSPKKGTVMTQHNEDTVIRTVLEIKVS